MMIILKKISSKIAFLIIICTTNSGIAQNEPIHLSFNDVLEIAHEQSPDALIAKHRYRSSYWQYRTYQAGYKPSLILDGNLPNYNRSIDVITQPDGSELFIKRQVARSSLNLSLSQNIPFTGGEVFLSSSAQRIDNFGDSSYWSYLTTPLTIGIRQPIFEYNPFRWDTKIEPIKYEEAKRKYVEDIEQVSIKATNTFFDLLLAQINLKIQQLNQANNDTLYQIALGRYNIGTIAENDLLQMELNFLNSNSSLEQAKLDVEMKLFNLRSFLRIKDDVAIEVIPPEKIPNFTINVQDALLEARNNRSEALAFDRRLLEAESEVNRAKMQNRFSADLVAIYGLTQTGTSIHEAYQDPLNEQQLFLGIQVPILDWGLAKGKIKIAESTAELIKTSVEQEQIDFNQEILIKVMQFNMQPNQVAIAYKSDQVAQKRYYVTKQRFLIGTIDIIELNLAQTDKDNNRKAYILALYNFWRNYYEIRQLTLFDFLNNQRIFLNLENIR
jgi:outer membrane protein TolC